MISKEYLNEVLLFKVCNNWYSGLHLRKNVLRIVSFLNFFSYPINILMTHFPRQRYNCVTMSKCVNIWVLISRKQAFLLELEAEQKKSFTQIFFPWGPVIFHLLLELGGWYSVYLNLRVSANKAEVNLAPSNDTRSKYFGTVHISTRDIQEHLFVCSRGVQS